MFYIGVPVSVCDPHSSYILAWALPHQLKRLHHQDWIMISVINKNHTNPNIFSINDRCAQSSLPIPLFIFEIPEIDWLLSWIVDIKQSLEWLLCSKLTGAIDQWYPSVNVDYMLDKLEARHIYLRSAWAGPASRFIEGRDTDNISANRLLLPPKDYVCWASRNNLLMFQNNMP